MHNGVGVRTFDSTEHPIVCEITFSCSWEAIFDCVNEGTSHSGMQHFTPLFPPSWCGFSLAWLCCLYKDDKRVYQAKYGGILLSAVLVHSSMSGAHIAMFDSQNKVHSYLAHSVCSCTGGNDCLLQLRPPVFAIVAAAPEYNHILFLICIVH